MLKKSTKEIVPGKCTHECDCDCHKDSNINHAVTCCLDCKFCKKNITWSQVRIHEITCHLKKQTRGPKVKSL